MADTYAVNREQIVQQHAALGAARAHSDARTVDGWSYRYGKRLVDLIGALIGSVAMLALTPIIGLIIKLDSCGPIFFRQIRPGRGRKLFILYKFRTMCDGAERLLPALERDPSQVLIDIKDDERVTRVGRLLRRTSLDELPQFINVLGGSMSLVGPRPFKRAMSCTDPLSLRRFEVKPGITGPWQINGRKNSSFDKAVAMDLEYIDRWSLRLDLKILAGTLRAVIAARGAR